MSISSIRVARGKVDLAKGGKRQRLEDVGRHRVRQASGLCDGTNNHQLGGSAGKLRAEKKRTAHLNNRLTPFIPLPTRGPPLRPRLQTRIVPKVMHLVQLAHARMPRPNRRVTRRDSSLESDPPGLLPFEEVAGFEVVGAEFVDAAEDGGGLDGEELEFGAELSEVEGRKRSAASAEEARVFWAESMRGSAERVRK
jgi:hypothetical protein